MLEIQLGGSVPGQGLSRRCVLRVGFLEAARHLLGPGSSGEVRAAKAGNPGDRRVGAIIQVFLGGGPSHLDSYDPKPDAPAEYRGEFRSIATNVVGVGLCEHLPRQAGLMDRLTLIRGIEHGSADHAGGTHRVMTGFASIDPTPRGNERPSVGSVVGRVLGARRAGIPPYLGIPGAPPFGQSAYLGPGFNPFAPGGDPNSDAMGRPLELPEGLNLDRLDDRRALLAKLDRLERRRDASGQMEGMDRFTAEAHAMVTGPSARRALDLTRESPKVRDRYGRTPLGQGCLLARRLVEAGARFVTVGDLGWDHHTEVFNRCRRQLPPLDAAIAGLVEDLHDRGLDREVMVLAWGEFGRTPRVNGSGGRDHWPGCMAAVVAGGGVAGGQIVGGSDRKGERPAVRALHPEDLIRTVYVRLGVDPRLEFANEAGRPLAVLNQGRPIPELL